MRVLPRVFRLPGTPGTYEARLVATGLWMGEAGHFCGVTAGHILRLEGLPRPARITIAMHTDRSAPGIEVVRLRPSDRPSVRRVDGFRVCATERVIAGLAAVAPEPAVGRALDDALRRGMTTIERITSFVDGEWFGRDGRPLLKDLLKGRDPRDERVRSVFETRMLRLLKRIKNEHFRSDFEVFVDGERFVLDFFHPQAGLGIECHSFKFHVGKHNEDARRDRKLRSTGMEILYFA